MDTPKIPTENRRVNMETHRPVGGSIQRKPLADCTNTVSRSSQQPSSSVKYANPSLTSSLKRIVAQTTIKEKPNHVNIPDASSGSASRSLSTNVRPVTRRMSADLGFPASAPVPTRPQNSRSDQGVGGKEFDEPYSVYTVRRKASGRKRNKEASSSSAVTRLRLDLISSSGKKTHQANENKPKPLKVAPKKKQRTVKHKEDNHGVPQDYIEQKRAYFAEVDAFELEEEEVSSSDVD